MNLLSSHRRRIITTTAVIAATLLSLSGFFSIIGVVDAARCLDCRDGGGGDGGSDGGTKRDCRYNGFTYSDGEIVRTPGGGQMKCEDGKWMAVGIGFQG